MEEDDQREKGQKGNKRQKIMTCCRPFLGRLQHGYVRGAGGGDKAEGGEGEAEGVGGDGERRGGGEGEESSSLFGHANAPP